MIQLVDINAEKKTDYDKILQNTFIDVEKELAPQPTCLSYGYKFNEHCPIVTYGNFCAIVGASKSYKSFLKAGFIAGYIGGNSTEYFPEIKGHDIKDKFIVDFDTEQSDYHVHKAAKRVVTMVGSNYNYYKPFALRSLTPNERMEFIEWVFNESDLKGKIGLCSIDGVADLVSDVNNLEQSNICVNKLMALTKDNNCGMITVIHRNYESDKPTGHLGSATLKKSETVLFVDKQESIAKVTAKYSRNIPIDEFSFTIEEGLPKEKNIELIF